MRQNGLKKRVISTHPARGHGRTSLNDNERRHDHVEADLPPAKFCKMMDLYNNRAPPCRFTKRIELLLSFINHRSDAGAQTVMQRALSTLHHTRPCAAFVHISRSVCTEHISRHGATCRANLPEGAHSTTDKVQHGKMRRLRQIGLLSASPVLPKLFHLLFLLLVRVVDATTAEDHTTAS